MKGMRGLFFVLFGLVAVTYAQDTNNTKIFKIDEYVSDIYYGNGIMTTYDEAQLALDNTLKPAIKYEIYNGNANEMNNYHNFNVAYNYTAKEKFGDTAIAMALDLMESYDQLGDTSWGWKVAQSLLSFVKGKGKSLVKLDYPEKIGAAYISKLLEKYGFSKWAADFLAGKIAEQELKVVEDMAKAMLEYDVDQMRQKNMDEMVTQYKNSIRQGHAVIMVTHSQGNLFAVEAADRIVGITELGEDAWMKNFLYHVSIASPATRFARSEYHYLASLDNDVVANIPGSVGTNVRNYARYFTHKATITPSTGTSTQMMWMENPPADPSSPPGYWIDGSMPDSYTKLMSYYDESLNISQEYRFEVLPDEWEYFQTNFHAFDFYMGKTVYPLFINANYKKTFQKDTRTKEYHSASHKLIMDSIKHAIDRHRKNPSQWIPYSAGCSCESKYARMEHALSPETMNVYLADIKVKDFAEGSKGKIYDADAGDHAEYVRAIDGDRSKQGAFTIEKIEEEGACYALKDDLFAMVGKIEGTMQPAFNPKSGAVQVTLTWGNPAIDFDLDVKWNAGETDIKDTGCTMEHFYISSVYDIYPGTYPIYVTHKQLDVNESTLIPENIKMVVQVPGKTEVYDIDINTTAELEVGHVADIFVKYKDNEIVPDITPDPVYTPVISVITPGSGGGGSYTGGGNSGGGSSGESIPWVPIDSQECKESCGCIPCEYKIIPYLEQLLYGPLAGADISLYEAVDYRNKTPLYIGKTSSGDTLYTAGNIEIPDNIVSNLHDDTLYLLVARGGVDIDHNDNFELDDIPILNKGESHLLLSGKDIKEIGFKMNVLTEIAYQVTKDIIDVNTTQDVINKLDEVSKRVLKDKIYGDTTGGINHKDLSFWMPTIHKPLLIKDYDEHFSSLVENLFANLDIYQEAYQIVYNYESIVPTLQSVRIDINEDISSTTVVGKVPVLDEGDSKITSFALEGEGNENFTIDTNGYITIADDTQLDYESKTYYQLYASASNESGISKKVLVLIQLHNVVDAPEYKSFTPYTFYENSEIGTEVIRLLYDTGNSPLQSALLTGEDSQYFIAEVDGNNISVKINKALLNYITKRAYKFQLQVTNLTESSSILPIVIQVSDRRDIPRLGDTKLRIDENASGGTVVGKVNIISDGYSPITHFNVRPSFSSYYYTTWPDGYFTIDNNGTVKLNENATLDYETRSSYSAKIKAVNAMGESLEKYLYINLNNIPDVAPSFTSNSTLNLAINKETNPGALLTNLSYNSGDSSVTSVKLDPQSPFEATFTNNGYYGQVSINLKSSIKDTQTYEYDLKAILNNSAGESEPKPIHITINKESYEFSVLEGTYGTVIGQIDFGSEPVQNIILPNDSTNPILSYFTLENNGTLSTKPYDKWTKTLNYKERGQFSFTATIVYENGISKKIGITINVLSRIISTLDTPGAAKKVILNREGNRAYVADYNYGLQVIDITDMYNPKIISSLDTNGAANDLVLSKNEQYVYLLDVGKSLKVIDISDEASPHLVSEVALSGYSYNVSLSSDESLAFVSHGTYGIEVIDIADPTSPTIIQNIGFLGTLENGGANYNYKDVQPGGYSYVVVDGNRLYSVDWNYGLQVIDISDLKNPVNVYAESFGQYGHSATEVHLHQEQKLISVVSTNDMPMSLYSINENGKVEKIRFDTSYDEIEVFDYNIAYRADYAMIGYDAYNPTAMSRLLYLDLGQSYGMVLDKNQSIAYLANGKNGLKVINLAGIEQPVHHEPVLGGSEFNIPEQNLSSITVDDLLGSVSILKTGDAPVLRMWTAPSTYTSGGLDCGYTYYALSKDKRCEYDYSFFDVDEIGNIYINDIGSLAYENIGNMVPLSVYAENENGYESNQAKVMINIQENPEYTIKFQRNVIKVDQNISSDTPIANVIYKESQRELFLFGVYKTGDYYCNQNSVASYLKQNSNYNRSIAEIIESYCTESTQFSVDSEGNLYVNDTLTPGIYTVHIIAADRFGSRWLENQQIEILQ